MEAKILLIEQTKSTSEDLVNDLKKQGRTIFVTTTKSEEIQEVLKSIIIDLIIVRAAVPEDSVITIRNLVRPINRDMPIYHFDLEEKQKFGDITQFVNHHATQFKKKLQMEKETPSSPSTPTVNSTPPDREKRSWTSSIFMSKLMSLGVMIFKMIKKFFSDFFVVFISITASFSLAEWNRGILHRKETVTALESVRKDLMLDTTKITIAIKNMEEASPVLLEAMNGQIAPTDIEKIKILLEGLRAYHGVGVQVHGYHLFSGIRSPNVRSPRLVLRIGVYYERSSPAGNYGGFNKEYSDITFENYTRLFEVFPNYLHPDTAVANQAILAGAKTLLESPYWRSRISLTYRQVTSLNMAVHINHKNYAATIIDEIEQEIREDL